MKKEKLITEVIELVSELLNDSGFSNESKKQLERTKEIMAHPSIGSTRLPKE